MTMTEIAALSVKRIVNWKDISKKYQGVKREKNLDPTRWYELPEWEELPENFRIAEVRPYFDELIKHKADLKLKRAFDVTAASVLLVILALPMGVISIAIKLDSEGPVFYRQERVTTYGQVFKIHKFRTMVNHADRKGSEVTVSGDNRITKVGAKLRGLRLDELPQIFDVLEGTMSFVGTRPEAVKYVKEYTPEMMATLLMPAGITSEASIRFKDESKLLDNAKNVDEIYIEKVLSAKMKWNLNSIQCFSLTRDILIMFRTVASVLKQR